MYHLFCLDNRVIGGAPDRIADLADLGQFVDQQLFLGHVDSSEAKIVRHDIPGVAEHVGAFDHLATPGCACHELTVDRLAQRSIAFAFRGVAEVPPTYVITSTTSPAMTGPNASTKSL